MNGPRQPSSTDGEPEVATAAGRPPAGAAPARGDWLGAQLALADLALGAAFSSVQFAQHLTQARHLAFLPPEALDLDLSDDAQLDVGDYALLEKIGQGGMGVVYRARQKSLDRDVAVKLLAAGPWASRDFIERFRREAQSAARMQHPNIVSIFEVGAHDDLNYFSMQLVRGESLAGLLAREGALAPRHAAALLRTVAEAVDYAHRLGVLHLDLKPGNVLIDERGEPQVADFGLARRLDETLATDSDEVSGTPSYMAPEQAVLRSHKLSPATDVYGLGAILYELLLGRPPFLGPNAQATLQRVVDTDVERPRRLRPALPADIEAICLKCLEKEPARRYASARGLAQDLAAYLEDRPVSVRTLGTGQRLLRAARREPRITALAALLLLALAGGLAATSLQWRRAELGAAHSRASLWDNRIESVWRDLPTQGPLAAVPAMVANLAEQEASGAVAEVARSRVRLGTLQAAAPQLIDRIRTEGAIDAIVISPKGDWVASVRADALSIHDVATGAERCQARIAPATGVALEMGQTIELRPAGDGRGVLALPLRASVFPRPNWSGARFDTIDCAPYRAPAGRFGPHPHLTWSPDAEYVIARRDVDAPGQLLRLRDGSRIAEVEASDLQGNAWLIAPGLVHVAVAADEWRRIDVLDPATLVLRHRYVHDERATLRASTWTADGTSLALAFTGGDVLLLDPATGTTRPMATRGDSEPLDLAFDRAERWLAASYGDGTVRVWDVASGREAGTPIRNPPGFVSALPDAERGTVLVQTRRAVQLWSLETGAEPTLQWQRAEFASRSLVVPSAWDSVQDLLATGNDRGELRLWRGPAPILPLPVLAPPLALIEADPPFDGRHVVGVDGARIEVWDLERGAVATPPIQRSQAVSFAVLAPDPAWLVSSAGRELQVHDWREGKLVYPPILLQGTPTVVSLAPNWRTVLVGHSARHGERNVTVLESYVLATGARSGRVELDGLYELISWSGDGRRVMTALYGTVHLLDAGTLAEIWPALRIGDGALEAMREFYARPGPIESPNSLRGPIAYPSLDRDTGTLWLYLDRRDLAPTDAAESRYQLLAIDALSGRARRTLALDGPVGTMRALPDGRVVLAALDRDEVWVVAADGSRQSLSIPMGHNYAGFALGADGRRLAIATSRGTVVLDVESMQWLAPPFRGGIDHDDVVSGLAFDADGTQLLLRTLQRRWVRHTLPVERRPLGRIEAGIRVSLDPVVAATGAENAAAVDSRLRAAIRAADRDPPAALGPTPTARAEPVTSPVELEARFVDLRPACTTPPQTWTSDFGFTWGRMLPPGRHRLLGTDFELHCGVHASTYIDGTFGGREPIGQRSRPVPVSLPHAGAVELLLAADTLYFDLADLPYAWLEFGYRDGSVARAPIVYRRHVLENWQSTPHGGEGRVAYHAVGGREAKGGDVATLYAVRIDNPHPERDLAQLVVEAVDRPWSTLLLLAATLEDAAAAATAPQRANDDAAVDATPR